MAAVYSDRGFGVRGPVVFYNRSNEAAAQLKPATSTGTASSAAGVRWFHSGGIFASLSETTAELIIEAMQAAKTHGAVVSFDLNYREKLWRARRAAPTRAVAVLGRIVEHVDVLVGNEEDLQKGLGIPGPQVGGEVEARSQRVRRHDGRASSRASRNMKIVATTLREVHSTSRHAGAPSRGSAARRTSRRRASSTSTIASAAATGSPSGFFYGLLTGASPERSRPPRLGARRAADDVPWRHDDGEPGAGARVRAGRIGADCALTETSIAPTGFLASSRRR